jgi:hypothetical protein
MKTTFLGAALAAGLFLAGTAGAQNYAIDWFTIDGGGGTSTGGVFALSGTIGQPDAGQMTNGPYSLAGGFWGVVALQTAGAPPLLVERLVDGTVRVFWELPAPGFVLECVTSLANPPATNAWSPAVETYQTNATHIFITVPNPAGKKFYRLRR